MKLTANDVKAQNWAGNSPEEGGGRMEVAEMGGRNDGMWRSSSS